MLGAGAGALVLVVMLTACSIHIGSSASATGNGSGGITEKIKIVHGQDGATLVLLPVMINGQGPFTFALDTGASTSLIDRPLAQKLNLPQNGTPQPISGVAGNEQSIPVKVDTWSVGTQITLPASTVSSANLFASQRNSGLQGLIGSDIWTQYGKITIDYDAQTLTVYKQLSWAGSSAVGWTVCILARDATLPEPARDRPVA